MEADIGESGGSFWSRLGSYLSSFFKIFMPEDNTNDAHTNDAAHSSNSRSYVAVDNAYRAARDTPSVAQTYGFQKQSGGQDAVSNNKRMDNGVFVLQAEAARGLRIIEGNEDRHDRHVSQHVSRQDAITDMRASPEYRAHPPVDIAGLVGGTKDTDDNVPVVSRVTSVEIRPGGVVRFHVGAGDHGYHIDRNVGFKDLQNGIDMSGIGNSVATPDIRIHKDAGFAYQPGGRGHELRIYKTPDQRFKVRVVYEGWFGMSGAQAHDLQKMSDVLLSVNVMGGDEGMQNQIAVSAADFARQAGNDAGKILDKYDSNRDGKLSPQELDTNRDGVVSINEIGGRRRVETIAAIMQASDPEFSNQLRELASAGDLKDTRTASTTQLPRQKPVEQQIIPS